MENHLDFSLQLSSTKPYIRKKAVLLMYKVFLSFPDALRPAFPRLKEKLEDPDPGILWWIGFRIPKGVVDLPLVCVGVQSAAVNVICELARKNPKNYLSLAPIFFKLMTSSTNNWMLIKIIKLVKNIENGAFPYLSKFLRQTPNSLNKLAECDDAMRYSP